MQKRYTKFFPVSYNGPDERRSRQTPALGISAYRRSTGRLGDVFVRHQPNEHRDNRHDQASMHGECRGKINVHHISPLPLELLVLRTTDQPDSIASPKTNLPQRRIKPSRSETAPALLHAITGGMMGAVGRGEDRGALRLWGGAIRA